MKNEYRIEGDLVTMEVQGAQAIFDLADFPVVDRFGSWKLVRGTSVSADFRNAGKMCKITLHKLLTGSKFVKWLNGNIFDFRRANMVPTEKQIRSRHFGGVPFKPNEHRIEGETVFIQVRSKNKETETYVDLEDYPLISGYKWNLNPVSGYVQTVKREGKVDKHYYMHRVIVGAEGFSVKVDHLNGDKLDNRRNNLRICGNSENLHNNYKHRTGTVAGVSRVVFWEARIQVNRVPYIKRFKTKEEAIAQRLKWEKELNPSGLNDADH